MKTGNTSCGDRGHALHDASMEPGHEDREYVPAPTPPRMPYAASMEPGHEDREYDACLFWRSRDRHCLNGARP